MGPSTEGTQQGWDAQHEGINEASHAPKDRIREGAIHIQFNCGWMMKRREIKKDRGRVRGREDEEKHSSSRKKTARKEKRREGRDQCQPARIPHIIVMYNAKRNGGEVVTSRKAYIVARIASPLILTLDSPIPSMLASSALVTGGFIFMRVIDT